MTVKAQYTTVPGTIEIVLDNDIVFAEVSLVNGQVAYTSGPITNLSAGTHHVFIDYFGAANIGYSSTTISIPSLIGGVVLARAMREPRFSDEIL